MADDILRFQAYGTSRWPLIRDGETILVRPAEPGRIKSRDFILYRSYQGNLAADIFDQKIEPRQIIGRIIAVERGGQGIKIGNRAAVWRRYLRFLAWPGLLAEKVSNRLFRLLQRSKLYRKLLRRYWGGGVTYSLVVGHQAQVANIIHCRGQSFLDLRVTGLPTRFKQHHLVAKKKDRIIGRLCLNGFSPDFRNTFDSGWWIFGCYTRPAWRGLGVCEGLLQKTFEVLKQEKVPAVYLTVRADNAPAVRLYEKMGFVRIEVPEIEEKLQAEAAAGRCRRILMERRL